MLHSAKMKHPINSLSDPALPTMTSDDIDLTTRESSFTVNGNPFEDQGRLSTENMSPMMMSPWNQFTPYTASTNVNDDDASFAGSSNNTQTYSVIGSLVREEGHIYSLATNGDLLYTGSDSKNIRVWKNLKEFSAFKSASGLVKAIVITGSERIFTGHQDGKIRVWKVSPKKPNIHKRFGSLPTIKDILKASIKPSSYVEIKRHRSTLYLKHLDAISCLSLSDDLKLLYSASWDKTFKVWRISDSKCLESVVAHEDAVNSVVAGAEGLVFTGSADGSVKVWRREMQGKRAKHFFTQTLLKHECAVTSLAVNPDSSLVYCGSSDGMINFWESEKNLAHGGVLKGHKLAVLCMVARDKVVFSGSADKTIYVWRREETVHTCMAIMTGHGGPVKFLAVEDDKEAIGKRYIVYSGSLDKSIKVWSVNDEKDTAQRQHVVDQSNSAAGS